MKTKINPLYIKNVKGKGRGVFCAEPLKKGQIVEICPVTIIPSKQQKSINETTLVYYHFDWRGGSSAVAWGYGSMYNHSEKPNSEFFYNYPKKSIRFRATKDIPANTEITVDYGWEEKFYKEKGIK